MPSALKCLISRLAALPPHNFQQKGRVLSEGYSLLKILSSNFQSMRDTNGAGWRWRGMAAAASGSA
jgi:hypothetical protein